MVKLKRFFKYVFKILYARLITLPTIFNKINQGSVILSNLRLHRPQFQRKKRCTNQLFSGKENNMNTEECIQRHCHLPRIPLFGMNIAYTQ